MRGRGERGGREEGGRRRRRRREIFWANKIEKWDNFLEEYEILKLFNMKRSEEKI